MEGYIGQIVLFAGNFAPRFWAFCNGQLLAISQNTALFSIIGTTYGGNGQTTFALPNLQGRVPLHPGQGTGLSPYSLGQAGGQENVTLLSTQIPAHNHLLNCSSAGGNAASPVGAFPANGQDKAGDKFTVYGQTANATMDPAVIGVSGGSQPHNNIQPYLGINYIICLQGIFPSRN